MAARSLLPESLSMFKGPADFARVLDELLRQLGPLGARGSWRRDPRGRGRLLRGHARDRRARRSCDSLANSSHSGSGFTAFLEGERDHLRPTLNTPKGHRIYDHFRCVFRCRCAVFRRRNASPVYTHSSANRSPKPCSMAARVRAKGSASCSQRVWQCSPLRPVSVSPSKAARRTPRRERGAQGS